jgi:2-polyprenyl-3-methyl-5-hydroxy-6-metoxy-1,4-benzoquinol methylase
VHSLKEGWSRIVRAEDYDAHMERVGQTQANAALVREGLVSLLSRRSRILFAGAGTGSLFDFADFTFLNEHDVTFADINPEFLAVLKTRAEAHGIQGFMTVECDLESYVWPEAFDLVVLVLVLEHVREDEVLRNLSSPRPDRFFVVIQQNPAEVTTNVSPNRPVPDSLRRAAEFESPHLVDRKDLVALFEGIGFGLCDEAAVEVPDGKKMNGLTFERRPRG